MHYSFNNDNKNHDMCIHVVKLIETYAIYYITDEINIKNHC